MSRRLPWLQRSGTPERSCRRERRQGRTPGSPVDWVFPRNQSQRRHPMPAITESTKRKLSLLQLAEKLGNVSKACRIMGYHRDTFYEVRRAFQVGGVAALVEKKRGPRSPHPNRVAPEIEERILALCLEHPTWGAQRIANELRLTGVNIKRHGRTRGLAKARSRASPPAAAAAGKTGPGRDDHAQRKADTPARAAPPAIFACAMLRLTPPENSSIRTLSTGEPSRAWARSTCRSSSPSARWPSPRSTPRRCL